MTAKNFYSEIVQKVKVKATSVKYFEKMLAPQEEINWEQVYMIPRQSTIESKMRSFQFKILHNVLFLNAKLFKMHIVDTPLCWFCKEENETPIHLFSQCVVTTSYWEFLQDWLKPSLKLPNLTPESALLGITTPVNNDRFLTILINYLLLIFKRSVYEMRFRSTPPSVYYIKARVKHINKIEYIIAKDSCNLEFHFKKWEIISNLLEN